MAVPGVDQPASPVPDRAADRQRERPFEVAGSHSADSASEESAVDRRPKRVDEGEEARRSEARRDTEARAEERERLAEEAARVAQSEEHLARLREAFSHGDLQRSFLEDL